MTGPAGRVPCSARMTRRRWTPTKRRPISGCGHQRICRSSSGSTIERHRRRAPPRPDRHGSTPLRNGQMGGTLVALVASRVHQPAQQMVTRSAIRASTTNLIHHNRPLRRSVPGQESPDVYVWRKPSGIALPETPRSGQCGRRVGAVPGRLRQGRQRHRRQRPPRPSSCGRTAPATRPRWPISTRSSPTTKPASLRRQHQRPRIVPPIGGPPTSRPKPTGDRRTTAAARNPMGRRRFAGSTSGAGGMGENSRVGGRGTSTNRMVECFFEGMSFSGSEVRPRHLWWRISRSISIRVRGPGPWPVVLSSRGRPGEWPVPVAGIREGHRRGPG